MQPIDYRNAIWEDVMCRVDGKRERVLRALGTHGPCTTRQLAQRMSADILSVRPRITELYQLGLVVCNDDASGHEGIYRALDPHEARRHFDRLKAEAQPKQLALL